MPCRQNLKAGSRGMRIKTMINDSRRAVVFEFIAVRGVDYETQRKKNPFKLNNLHFARQFVSAKLNASFTSDFTRWIFTVNFRKHREKKNALNETREKWTSRESFNPEFGNVSRLLWGFVRRRGFLVKYELKIRNISSRDKKSLKGKKLWVCLQQGCSTKCSVPP